MHATMLQVKSDLSGYEGSLREVVEEGWATWLLTPPELRLHLDRRARACCVWCYIVGAAKKRFEGDPNVRVVEKEKSAFFIFDDRVVVRFKKLDSDGASSNIPTSLQVDFREQLEFPGIPSELPRIDVGYVLNDLETGIEKTMVSQPSGRRGVAWAYALLSEQEEMPSIAATELPAAKVRCRDEAGAAEHLPTGTSPEQG